MLIYLFIFITGTVFASFVHAYVTRLLKGESIVAPRSHCTNCNHVLSWYELIPIVSYIVQKGRCRKCGIKIGLDSLVVEILTGCLFVIVYFIYGMSYKTLLGFVVVLLLISIFLSDFKEMIILDSTLVTGIVLTYILVYLDLGFWEGPYKSFLYGIAAFVLLFVMKVLGDAVFKRESLGGGDIKLAFLMGSILPFNLFLIALIIGSLTALPYALYISLFKKTNELAFGPFLTLGLFVTFLFQNNILDFLNLLIY